jgi:hypothetical protein
LNSVVGLMTEPGSGFDNMDANVDGDRLPDPVPILPKVTNM